MHDHDPRWERNWRRMEAMARRGFRQFGNFNVNLGDWGGFGGNFRIGRMLASGDLRLVALYLIEQQPRHGYDLIKAIEEQSHGLYSPSPGVIYPALTFLEEAGYVTSAAEGNKKLYTITDEGRSHLADNREAIESTLDFLEKAGARMHEWRDRMSNADFGTEQAERFDDMGRHGRPFGERGPPPPPPRPPHPPRPDQAPRQAGPLPRDVDEARKALKRALKDAVRHGPDEERRVIEILHRAADEIRRGRPRAEEAVEIDRG